MSPPKPDPQEQARQLRRQIQTFIQSFGLHQEHQTPCGQPLSVPYAHALMHLLEADDGLRIMELGEYLNIDKSNVSRLCARMKTDGHVERRPCPHDGRAKRLYLTDAGRRLATEVNAASLERFTHLINTLDNDQPADILVALNTLNGALATLSTQDQDA